jgi:HPt (histidine-containing phosphotransfer) domain-containing protein
MNEYVTKPISAERLVKAIDNLLGVKMIEVKKVTPPEMLNPNSVLDFDHLEKVSMGDEMFQREVVSSYLDDVVLRSKRIESFINTREIDKVLAEAHTIKGASFSIGAKKMGEEALAVEISAKHADIENIKERFAKLITALNETKEVIKEFLQDGEKIKF